MKKVYLVHGWGGNSKGGWFDWLKKEGAKENIKVHAFDMPDTENPKIKAWTDYLEKNISKLDEETYLIGHSIGCQAIMRFLEKTQKNKLAGCIFVSGWFSLKGLEKEELKIMQPWIENPINFEKVKSHTKNFMAIFSKNDPLVPISNADLFKEKLNAEIIIKDYEGHFNETTRINEIMDFIKT